MNRININGTSIGVLHPPYIVAELSANHNGSLRKALETIKMAKDCGANAIKLQTYTPDTLTIDSTKDDFKIKGGNWDGYTLYELYKEAQTPYSWHKEIFKYCQDIDLTCFSTPFDEEAVDFLESLGAPAYKIASFEATDLSLIRYAASKQKPIIISTGMASEEEVVEAFEAAKSTGNNQIIMLHCISSYPAPIDESNLRTIPDISKKLDCTVGLSDHTLGNNASITSIALGGCFIEKHFILDKEDEGPDSSFSITPDELRELTKSCYEAWQALGVAGYERKEAEQENIKFRRSIYTIKDIKKGQTLDENNIKRIRPGFGLPPKHFNEILGKKTLEDLERGTALSWDFIED